MPWMTVGFKVAEEDLTAKEGEVGIVTLFTHPFLPLEFQPPHRFIISSLPCRIFTPAPVSAKKLAPNTFTSHSLSPKHCHLNSPFRSLHKGHTSSNNSLLKPSYLKVDIFLGIMKSICFTVPSMLNTFSFLCEGGSCLRAHKETVLSLVP